MYVKTGNKERKGRKFNMKGILFHFDNNCVANVSGDHAELISKMNVEPYLLEILENYDPKQVLIEEKRKDLEKLKIDDLKSLALELQIEVSNSDTKKKIIEYILEKCL